MLRDNSINMKAVFIHEVSEIYSRNSEHAYKVDQRYMYPDNVFFYDTAAGAAYQALREGLISRESAEVVISKVQGFYERNHSSACNTLQRRELGQLRDDLGKLEELLASFPAPAETGNPTRAPAGMVPTCYPSGEKDRIPEGKPVTA